MPKLQSALCGGIVSVGAMAWVSLNAQLAIASGDMQFEHKPSSIDQCTYEFELPPNATTTTSTLMASPSHAAEIFPLFRMSYMWYTAFGTAVAIAVAHLAAVVFGFNELADVDAALVAPFLRDRCGGEGGRGEAARQQGGSKELPPHILGDDTCAKAGATNSRVFLKRVAALQDESSL